MTVRNFAGRAPNQRRFRCLPNPRRASTHLEKRRHPVFRFCLVVENVLPMRSCRSCLRRAPAFQRTHRDISTQEGHREGTLLRGLALLGTPYYELVKYSLPGWVRCRFCWYFHPSRILRSHQFCKRTLARVTVSPMLGLRNLPSISLLFPFQWVHSPSQYEGAFSS